MKDNPAKVKCKCECHDAKSKTVVLHFLPCCIDGYLEVDKRDPFSKKKPKNKSEPTLTN